VTRAALVEVLSCQICGAAKGEEMFRDPPFRVLRCPACSLVYVTPRHDDDALHELYGSDYWNSSSPKTRGYAGYAEEEPLYLKTFRKRARLVARFTGPGPLKILDVGCAAGFFLRVMQEAGHQVRGVELSREIARHAIEALGEENVHVGELAQLPHDAPRFESGSFDLVTLWDVVEHVPDPQSMLRRVHRLLKPDGVLMLETQNVDSRFALLLGRKWQHFKHEEHLYHFNPSTVTELLAQSGFQVVHNSPAYGGKYVSLGFIAERAGRLSRVAGTLCRPLHLLKRLNLYLNLNDEMIVAARPCAPERGTT
jgi:SAM-dependent methyltransferase